jgi:hypothetical protein
MPELPSQPNLDNLRHQARRLLRDAQAGDPGALERMGTWSTRITLSAAQLAIAREYGWRSWEALRHYVEALAWIAEPRHSPPDTMDRDSSSGVPTGVWRGKGEVLLRGGILRPGTLTGWGSHGLLEAEFASSLLARQLQGALDTVLVTDDLGTDYGRCEIRMISNGRRLSGEPNAPIDLEVAIEPAPPSLAGWVELLGINGSSCRLTASSTRGRTQTSPAPDPAEREVRTLAHSVLRAALFGPAKVIPHRCASVLARVGELEQGAAPPAREALAALHRLCEVVAGSVDDVTGLPVEWAAMLRSGERHDGAALHYRLGMTAPVVEGVELAVGALISDPATWRLTASASPGWWGATEVRSQEAGVFRVFARDDLGGSYVAYFIATEAKGHDDIEIQFRPRLAPDAREVAVVLEAVSASLTVLVDLGEA